jgi:hypothetical protein
MQPRWPLELNGIMISREEHQAILKARLETLKSATAVDRLGGPLPVRWRVGWDCSFKPVKRSRDGSLLVLLTATDASRPGWKYERRIRLVKARRLSL